MLMMHEKEREMGPREEKREKNGCSMLLLWLQFQMHLSFTFAVP